MKDPAETKSEPRILTNAEVKMALHRDPKMTPLTLGLLKRLRLPPELIDV